MVLLGTAPRGATADELARVTRYLADWAKARRIRLSDELDRFDRAAIRATADTLVNSGLILRNDEGSETVYTIEPSKHPMASYYRNSVIHHFLPKTLIELALFRLEEDEPEDATARFWAEIERLRDLFKFEFFYQPREIFRREIEEELDRTDGQWAAHLNGGAKGIKSLIRRCQPLLGHAALLPFVEAYIVVFELLVRLKEGEVLSQADCVEQGLVEGRQAYLLRRISSEASIGKILFENGYKLATHMELTGPTDSELATRRRAMLADLRALARRMERMRIAVLDAAEQEQAVEGVG
jgi:glycerol-3-phosphate O-acyltransferase